MVILNPAQEVEQTLSSLTWERLWVTCLFCYDDNGKPTGFWVTRNEYQCEKCGKRGNVRDMPLVKLNGSVS